MPCQLFISIYQHVHLIIFEIPHTDSYCVHLTKLGLCNPANVSKLSGKGLYTSINYLSHLGEM